MSVEARPSREADPESHRTPLSSCPGTGCPHLQQGLWNPWRPRSHRDTAWSWRLLHQRSQQTAL